MTGDGAYSGIAAQHACEPVLSFPAKAQSLSSVIVTTDGLRLRLSVVGHPPYKVFWSSEGPRIEAVFPHS